MVTLGEENGIVVDLEMKYEEREREENIDVMHEPEYAQQLQYCGDLVDHASSFYAINPLHQTSNSEWTVKSKVMALDMSISSSTKDSGGNIVDFLGGKGYYSLTNATFNSGPARLSPTPTFNNLYKYPNKGEDEYEASSSFNFYNNPDKEEGKIEVDLDQHQRGPTCFEKDDVFSSKSSVDEEDCSRWGMGSNGNTDTNTNTNTNRGGLSLMKPLLHSNRYITHPLASSDLPHNIACQPQDLNSSLPPSLLQSLSLSIMPNTMDKLPISMVSKPNPMDREGIYSVAEGKSTTTILSHPPRAKKAIADNLGNRTSIYRGVTKHRWTGRYEAHLWDNSCRREGQARKGRQVYLGGYKKEEKAARTYDIVALKYWGPTTTINFLLSDYEKEMEEMKHMTRQEVVACVRRKSSGFSRGASIYRGVTRHHQQGRWQARIGRVAGNKDLYLGTFSTEEEAAEAYDIAAIQFRGVNAVTNFELNRYNISMILASTTPLPIEGLTKRSQDNASDVNLELELEQGRLYSNNKSLMNIIKMHRDERKSIASNIGTREWKLVGYKPQLNSVHHLNPNTKTNLHHTSPLPLHAKPPPHCGLFSNTSNDFFLSGAGKEFPSSQYSLAMAMGGGFEEGSSSSSQHSGNMGHHNYFSGDDFFPSCMQHSTPLLMKPSGSNYLMESDQC